MSLLGKLNTAADVAEERDIVGGDYVWDSAIVDTVVEMAHVRVSDEGAIGIVLTLKDANAREVTDTLWIQSKTSKGGKTYYEKDGKKHRIPGNAVMNSLTLLALGKNIEELEDEEKTIKLWDFDAKAELPVKAQVLTELLGKPIAVGVLRTTVDKNAKGDDGKFHPTGKTRDKNTFDKFFRADDHLTVTEIKAEATDPVFYDKWNAKWAGNVKDESTKMTDPSAKPGMPTASGTPATKSLFPQA